MTLGEFLDLVIAVTAVVAVIVAIVYGRQAMIKATETLERSRLDYLGACADRVSQAFTDVLTAHGAFRAQLQPFWKVPDDLDQDSVGVTGGPDDEKLSDAEVEIHASVYKLEAAKLALVSALDSLRPLVRSIDWYDRRQGDDDSTGFDASKLDEIVDRGEVAYRSVFPNYLVLIRTDPFGKRTRRSGIGRPEATSWFSSELDLDEQVMAMVREEVSGKVAELIEDQAIRWTGGGDGDVEPLDVLVAVGGDAGPNAPIHMSLFTDAFTAWAVECLADTTRDMLTVVYRAAAARPSVKNPG